LIKANGNTQPFVAGVKCDRHHARNDRGVAEPGQDKWIGKAARNGCNKKYHNSAYYGHKRIST
jgi:hypothetical protein